jgi:transposase
MSGLFDDPRRALKDRASQFVIPESQILKAIKFSNNIIAAAKHINVSKDRFKNWASRYVDSETGLTLLELQHRNLLIERASKVGDKSVKTRYSNSTKVDLTEKQIRDAMEVANSNKEAAEFLHVSTSTYKKYATKYIDEETGMNLFEIQYEKWRKISYERYMAKKETGWFEKLAARKKGFYEARFKKGEFDWESRPDDWKYKGLQLSEEVVRNAIKNTRSNKEAAKWLNITYKTWKKYAKSYIDPVTKRTLFDCHMATGGKGIPKAYTKKTVKTQNPRALELGYQLIKGQHLTTKRITELTKRLMKDGRLGHSCSECGYSSKRPIDMKMPLMLNFKNGDRTDWREENLRWLCYNCSFILALDYTTRTQREILHATAPESPDATDEVVSFYQIDGFYIEHLKQLGVKDLVEEVNLPQKDDKNPELDDLIDYQ